MIIICRAESCSKFLGSAGADILSDIHIKSPVRAALVLVFCYKVSNCLDATFNCYHDFIYL